MTFGRTITGGFVVAALFPALLYLAACATAPIDERAFHRAERIGTASAYERFLDSYPNSSFAAEARKRAAELRDQETLGLFEAVKNARKASILERFVAEHPGTKAAFLAKLRIAEIDFHDLANDNPFRPYRPSNNSWAGFLQYYAFGDYIPVPKDPDLRATYYKKLHPLILAALQKLESFDAWIAYFLRYPDSPYFEKAAEQVEDFLLKHSDKWKGYEMLETYFALYDKIKKPCPHRDELIRKFQEGLAEAVKRTDSIEEYKRYLETFPDSPHKKEIILAMARLEFSDALLRNNRKKMEELIKKYPEAKTEVAKAKARLEQLDFEDTVRKGTAQAFLAFKKKYQGQDLANLVPEVERRLRAIHDRMLAKAKAARKASLFREILKLFPDSPDKDEILRLLEEAEFNEAIAARSKARLETLLKRYPNSKFRERALKSIEKIDFESAILKAKEGPSTAPLVAYLKTYPTGAYAQDARRLIAEITRHHDDYMREYRRARVSGDVSRFSAWIAQNQGNFFAARRGRQDLENLRREVAVRSLVADVTSTPAKRLLPMPAVAIARMLEEYTRSVAYVETDIGSSTGFIFNRNGLLLTNACIIRNANPNKISATIRGRGVTCRIVALPDPGGPDVAVLRVQGVYDPIPLGNSATLGENEKVNCIWARGARVERAIGVFLGTRRSGGNEWLIIQSSKVPSDLGGIILNRRARAVAIIVRPRDVDPAVKKEEKNVIYALSLRSALPVMTKAVEKSE